MVSIQNGRLVPLNFSDIQNPQTGKTRVRNVDVTSKNFTVARGYMLRLEGADFTDHDWSEKLAHAGNLALDDLKKKL